MAKNPIYRSQNDPRILEELSAKEEYAIIRDAVDSGTDIFTYKRYQLFVKTFMHPFTGRKRLLVKHGTGTGKTLTALLLIREYCNIGRSCFVIGPNHQRFIDDFLKYTDLGFISNENVKILKEAASDFNQGKISSSDYQNLRMKIYRESRSDAKAEFRFMTFKELQLEMFGATSNMTINLELIRSMKNSLIVVDEVHNLYNKEKKNLYGTALKLLVSILGLNVSVVLMSATPLGNSEEVCDLIDLLETDNVPTGEDALVTLRSMLNAMYNQLKIKPQVPKTENGDSTGQPAPFEITESSSGMPEPESEDEEYLRITREQLSSALREKVLEIVSKVSLRKTVFTDVDEMYIYNKLWGKVSSFMPLEFGNFPSSTYIGKKLLDEFNINVFECKMSEFQRQQLDMASEAGDAVALSRIADIAFTSMNGSWDLKTIYNNKGTSQYKEWSKENGIKIEENRFRKLYLDGDFLHNIGKYSAKYAALGDLMTTKQGKVFIFHPGTQYTGVLTVARFLESIGVASVDDTALPSSTRCVNCGKFHSTATKCQKYAPMRFAMIYGEMGLSEVNRTLLDFAAPENKTGTKIKCLIGSKMMSEGYDLNCIEHIFAFFPGSFPVLKQVIGRGVRTNSHMMLPENRRHVDIYIPFSGKYEEKYLRSKLEDYALIIFFENVLTKIAVDAQFFKNKIEDGPKIMGKKFLDLVDKAPAKAAKLSVVTYNSHKFYLTQVIALKRLLPKLFERKKIWEWEELYKIIRSYPICPSLENLGVNHIIDELRNSGYTILETMILDKSIMKSDMDVESIIRTNTPFRRKFDHHIWDTSTIQLIKQISALKKPPETLDKIALLRTQNRSAHIKVMQQLIFEEKYDELYRVYYGLIDFVYSQSKKLQVGGKGFARAPIGLAIGSKIVFVNAQHRWETSSREVPQDVESDFVGLFSEEMAFQLRTNIPLFEKQKAKTIRARTLQNDEKTQIATEKVGGQEKDKHAAVPPSSEISAPSSHLENQQPVREKRNSDKRKLLRGISCTSVNVQRIATLLKHFNISIKNKEKKKICDTLCQALIEAEVLERQKAEEKMFSEKTDEKILSNVQHLVRSKQPMKRFFFTFDDVLFKPEDDFLLSS